MCLVEENLFKFTWFIKPLESSLGKVFFPLFTATAANYKLYNYNVNINYIIIIDILCYQFLQLHYEALGT